MQQVYFTLNSPVFTYLIMFYFQFKEEQEKKRELASKPADFLAPYLVPFKDQEELTQEQSVAAYNACLNDLKSLFVTLLNNLQRQYEDVRLMKITQGYISYIALYVCS